MSQVWNLQENWIYQHKLFPTSSLSSNYPPHHRHRVIFFTNLILKVYAKPYTMQNWKWTKCNRPKVKLFPVLCNKPLLTTYLFIFVPDGYFLHNVAYLQVLPLFGHWIQLLNGGSTYKCVTWCIKSIFNLVELFAVWLSHMVGLIFWFSHACVTVRK